MTKHKHCDVIKAWADGAEIECLKDIGSGPQFWEVIDYPRWDGSTNYRVKPQQQTRTVWVNVYREGPGARTYHSKVDADVYADNYRIACVEVEIKYTDGEGL